jgi:hypothetical protein
MNTKLLLACFSKFLCVQILILAMSDLVVSDSRAQDAPSSIEVIDYHKLLPIFPNGPAGWTADEPEGSTDDAAGFALTTAHRDYKKGEADNAPITSISILDSVANPDYVASTTAAWKEDSSAPDGYAKPVTIEGNPGYETYENDKKHGTLWVMVAKRYFVQIETQGQEAKELQEWMKRIDLKKLAGIK